MAETVTLTFDELPLVREPGMTAAWVSGEAEITVWDHDDWSITGIYLDASDGKSAPRPIAELERGSWLFNTIHSELEANWKDQINERIADLIMEGV